MIESASATCPFCWASIELTVDCSAGDARYVEDCSVCCRPMTVSIRVDEDGTLAALEVAREND